MADFFVPGAKMYPVAGSRGNLYAETDNHDLKSIMVDTDPNTAMNTFLEMLKAGTWPKAGPIAGPDIWADAVFIDQDGRGVWIAGKDLTWTEGFGA